LNLPDLLRRVDRAVAFRSGSAEDCHIGAAVRRMRGIRLAPGTVMLLKDAHTYLALRDFPSDLQWQIAAGRGVRLLAEPHDGALPSTIICEELLDQAEERPLRLAWPLWVMRSGFDLAIEVLGDEPVVITVGRLLDPRAKMAPLIRGRGLELGPGLVPRIAPRDGLDIEYVEEKTPEEWQAVYGHGNASTAALTPEVMARYRVGSALTLAEWPADSLDFVFSNHVFEHLVNPLQVLRNWLGRLKAGGAVLAVVPDTRFTFDLRQPASTLEEIRAEEATGGHAVEDEKYHRWCRYTAPYNTIENLKERNYSIHVHYYTPGLFRDMADLLIADGECTGVFLDTVPNNKEFGVVLQR
jgi:SAM-dependent methyltransferase